MTTGDKNMEKSLKAEEIIRLELNIEKWSIWVSPNANGKPQVRIIERELNIEERQVKATVEIGYTRKGALTTFDQKVFYTLIKLWEESGETDSPTFFSLNRLARELQMGWGTTQIKLLKDSLDRLRITPFLWKHSFFNAEENKRLTVNEDPFFLITKLKTVSREEDGRQTKPQGYFQFHPLILNNLKANYRKPVLFNTILSFKSDHVQMLYSHLDLVLSGNDRYERTSVKLFEDLGITGASYKDKRRRKAKLNLILNELQEKPLSNGRFLKVSIADTKAKDDVKIVCVTVAAQQTKKTGEKPPTREESVLEELRALKILVKKQRNSLTAISTRRNVS